jgi:membrane protein implicated in regulation of membrane protease activity
MTENTRTPIERAEEELSWAGLAVAETIRVAELAVIALVSLFIVPPLAILAVIVLLPAVALAALAAVIALPVLVVRRFHRHRTGHAHRHVRRLAEQGRERAGTATSRLHRVLGHAVAKLGAHEPARPTP